MGFGWQLPVTSLWDLLTLCLFAGHYFSSLHAQDDPSSVTQPDSPTLLRFKHTISADPSGALSNWSLQLNSNSCSWFGVTCSARGARVIALDLTGCGLVAPFPLAVLSALDQLQELRLSGNAFYGVVEQEVVASVPCTTLSILDLSSNNLHGSFPSLSFWKNCKTLTHLNLSGNFFEGPVQLDAVGSLRSLDLSHNNLSGELASDFFLQCSALSWLDLSSNILSGSLPLGIGQCGTLQHLNVSFNLLSGTISLEVFALSASKLTSAIASCSNLTTLDLSSNLLTGPIPTSLGSCRSLSHVNLTFNSFLGNIPTTFNQLVNLERLSLSKNNLTGAIPPDFGNSLHQLKELDLSANDLVGTIPTSLASCFSLQYLNLGDNRLTGDFPEAIVSQMPALRTLILSFNNFTGPLPVSLTNSSSLEVLDLSANAFTGSIPGTLCGHSLRRLLLADNELSGNVPLESCSSLAAIDVSCNFLTRAFPTPLPAMPNMREIVMWGNFIEQEIPIDICSAASQLWLLVLNVNLLNGTIPPTLANCSSLEWLTLANNRLTGSIPPELGLMARINFLHLNNNSLSGTIPLTLGDCKYLLWLDLSSNELEGTIPRELTKQAGKVIKGTLDTSLRFAFFKHLRGDLCTEYGLGSVLTMRGVRPSRLSRIPNFQRCTRTRFYADIVPYYIPGPPESSQGGSYTYLDVGYNKLTGTIPQELGTLTYITVLSVSHNNLTGIIPFSLANLIRCSILHLDHNHLQGPIPPGLSKLGIMNQLDFSNNNLSGSVPESGKLPTFPASSFANNPYLCGTPLPPCDAATSTYDSSHASMDSLSLHQQQGPLAKILRIILPLIASFYILAGLFVYCSHRLTEKQQHMKEQVHDNSMDKLPINASSSIFHRSSTAKSPELTPLSINLATFEITPLRKICYRELKEATNGFSDEAIIGRGGFGEVYKATLKDKTVVAVKKLCHEIDEKGELRDFTAEMETIGKIKHPNLVSLLGYCKTATERLLVYEFMENGSLHSWLHEPNQATAMGLSWESRKRIAHGTAKGLLFLHKECFPNILHRDLKTANVLLDEALEARVADFGMARLVSAWDTHLSVSTLVGTCGYVPPEYGQSLRCTKRGDVFSFGVVLLELLTGRQPTWGASYNGSANGGHEEEGGVDLVGWVKRHIREGRAREVLDQNALTGAGVSGRAVISSCTSSSSCPIHVDMPMDLKKRESEMLSYLSVACHCVEDNPVHRPSIFKIMTAFQKIERCGNLDLM